MQEVSVDTVILINSSLCTMQRVAVMEDEKLVEILLEPIKNNVQCDSVCIGVVTKLVPHMGGAFVNIRHPRASLVEIRHNLEPFIFPPFFHHREQRYVDGSLLVELLENPRVNGGHTQSQIVKHVPKTSVKQGEYKKWNPYSVQHMRTRQWLHSHLHASPISGNLEVSCFGDDGNSDTGDQWRLEIGGSGKTWKQDQKIMLRHVDTSGYLHSYDKKYNGIAGGQQEVVGGNDEHDNSHKSNSEDEDVRIETLTIELKEQVKKEIKQEMKEQMKEKIKEEMKEDLHRQIEKMFLQQNTFLTSLISQ